MESALSHNETLEYRFTELRAADDRIVGTLIRYGDTAKIGGRFTERFTPGSVRYDDVIVNVMHNRTMPVARTGGGLELRQEGDALIAEIKPPDTTFARDARAMIDAGILRGLSMEFKPDQGKVEWRNDERIISGAELYGIGIVDRPAYKESEIVKRFELERGPQAVAIPIYY